jgi:hypothetical protein
MCVFGEMEYKMEQKNPNQFVWKDKVMEFKSDKTIGIVDTNAELKILLDQYDWYFDTRIEENCICVYVNKMTSEIMSLVPQSLYGYHIKIAFSGYLTCGEKYGATSPLMHALSSIDISDDE